MSSVSRPPAAASSPATATATRTAPSRTREPFAEMLATTLGAFAGASDPVRNRAVGASRVWQTQKQLAERFSTSERNTALEAAAGTAAAHEPSRADRLREDEESDSPNRSRTRDASREDEGFSQQADSASPEAKATRPSPEAGHTDHGAATKQQEVTQIREQRVVEANRQSNAATPGSTFESSTVSLTGTNEVMSPVKPNTQVPTPTSNTPQPPPPTAPQAVVPNAPSTQQRADAVKTPPSPTANAEGVQAAAKTTSAAGKGGGSNLDFQNLLGPSSSRKDEAAAKSAGASAKPTTFELPRGIDITKSQAMRELAEVVRSRIDSRGSTILMRLDPPELGRVQIDLTMERDVLTLRIEAQSQAGHDVLKARLAELRHALEQHGITINRVDVELRPPVTASNDPQASQHHSPQQDPAHQGQGQSGTAAGGSDPGRESHDGRGDNAEDDRQTERSSPAGHEVGGSQEPSYGERPSLSETGVDLVV